MKSCNNTFAFYMDRSNLRSQSLDLLRFPLAVIVIAIHVVYPGAYIELERNTTLKGIVCLLSGMFLDQSVPVYFFISGYVFFMNISFNKKVYIRKLKNRSKSLFFPYLIWNTIIILKIMVLALPCFAFLFERPRVITDYDWSIGAILMSYWNTGLGITHDGISQMNEIYPQDCPLWFVRDLMIVVLCTPLINKALHNAGKRANLVVLLLGLAWFVAGLFPFGHVNQLLTAFFFFSLGARMSIGHNDMISVFRQLFRPALCVYVLISIAYAFVILDYPFVANGLKKVNQLAGLIVAYDISALLIKKKVCRVNHFLTSASFFVYASNWIILYEMKRAFYILVMPETCIEYIFVYCITIIAVVMMSLGTFYLLQKYMPLVVKVSTGRK